MTAPIVGLTSTPRLVPYVSVEMFRNTRRGIDVDNLVPGGTPPEQDAALYSYILEASARADSICQQILSATYDTVTSLANVGSDGYVRIHPRFKPVIALTSFAIGPAPQFLTPYASLAGTQVMTDRFIVPIGAGVVPVMSSQGPIQFGTATAGSYNQFVQYTYVNGYPITELTAPVTAGATQISVADTTGIVAGQTWMRIEAKDTSHTFLAGTVSTAGANGIGTGPGTVACTPVPRAVTTSSPYPIMVTSLPADVIQACTLIVRALIKEAGGSNITGPTTVAPSQSGRPVGAGMRGDSAAADMQTADTMLRPYVAPIA